jgi:tetratricopeptide (TPR) repeat protein
MRVRGGLFGALLGAALGVASSAAAQSDSLPADRAELFAYLVRNPGDVRATLRYADLSKEAGDIEAAIGALERVLFYKPDEPNTRLYLGLLYARLGSYDMARGYFESVMEHPGTPQPIKDRAAYLMNEADKRTQPSQFHGYVRTGVRYQSNASGDPEGEYFAFDPDAGIYSVSAIETEQEGDWNAYLQTGFAYSYDFGTQTRDAFEATLTSYNTAQFELDEYNYNILEATAGVRFGIRTGNPTALASIKPYLIASGATVDYEEYFKAGGAGVQFSAPAGSWTLAPYLQAVYRDYAEDFSFDVPPDVEDEAGADGWVYSAGLRISSDPKAASRVQAQIGYERREVDDVEDIFIDDPEFNAPYMPRTFSTDYMNYHRGTFELRTPFDLYSKGHHILVTPVVGVRYTLYDSEDPFAPTFATTSGTDRIFFAAREDWQYRVGLSVDYAINDWAGVGGQLHYTVTDSNIPAYDIENLAVSFGPHFRF